MKIGETDQLAVDIDPSDASQEFEWEFDVEGIVSIDENNLLTALKGGTVNITVSCKENPELTDTYQLKVFDNIEGMDVDFTESMQPGSTQTIKVTIQRTRPDGSAISTMSEYAFESTNPEILTVDNKGVVTAVATGTAKIKVVAQDSGEFTVECEISVVDAVIKIGETVYTKLDEALEAAQEGDVIFLGAGYYTGNFVVTKDNITILGPNFGRDAALTGRDVEAEFKGELKVASGVKNFTLDGVAFSGAGTFNCVGTGENITVKNLYIHDTETKAWNEGRDNTCPSSISFNHLDNDILLKDITVSHCLFENLHWAGLYIARLYNVKVEYCTFHNFDQDAIRGDGGYNNGKWEFLNNKFYNDEVQGTNGIYLQAVSGDQILQEIHILNNDFINIGDADNNSTFIGAFSCRTYQEKGMRFYFKYNNVINCKNGLHVRNNGEKDLSKYTEEINYNIFQGITGFYHKNFNGSDTETSNPVEANFDKNLFLDAEGKVLTKEQVQEKVFEVKSFEGTFASVDEYTLAIHNVEGAPYTKYVLPTLAGQEANAEVTYGDLVLTVGVNGFATVKAAVDAAVDDDVIFVAAGTYTEDLAITKSITLSGPNAGVKGYDTRLPEAVLACKIVVSANNVTIDGFTCQSQTTFAGEGVIEGFHYLNNVLETFGGEGFVNGTTPEAQLKDLVISGNYSASAKGPRWFRFAFVENLEYTYNKATAGGAYSYLYVDKCLRGTVLIANNSFVNSAQDCFMIMGVGEMTMTIKDNYFKGMDSTVIDTRAMNATYAGDVTINVIHNTFDAAGANWRTIRTRDVDYGDHKLDVQVHYNAFINGCCTEIEGVKTYANNPNSGSTQLIYNMDNNYFQEVKASSLSAANFAGAASSWANCYDSFADVNAAYLASLGE